jgi:hypothetical protein
MGCSVIHISPRRTIMSAIKEVWLEMLDRATEIGRGHGQSPRTFRTYNNGQLCRDSGYAGSPFDTDDDDERIDAERELWAAYRDGFKWAVQAPANYAYLNIDA